MSSRALRRLQREEEAQKRKAEETSSDEEEVAPTKSKPLNAFQMLNIDGDEKADELDDEEEAMQEDLPPEQSKDEVGRESEDAVKGKNDPAPSSTGKKSKKKKKKRKTDNAPTPQGARPNDDPDWDEIDRAKHDLYKEGKWTTQGGERIDEDTERLYKLLAVDSKHLNALNEMKRLFGNVVLESNDDETSASRRRGRGPQNLDLGAALTARHSPISRGQGLKGPLLKRNPFMMGKEEWPQATGGGLSMELVENLSDGTTEYRFVHNSVYQGVQREFEACVASMDPQRLITLLMYNPYHVSTLLQVSEIAKQQGDHSVASDLLERALFTFGRAAFSSFATALSSGTARLDFRRPENREFWLASFRYVKDLGQRGTWRTAYEWAKLILSLDPESDPYCMHRVIDQLAVRSGQFDHFIQVGTTDFYSAPWSSLPNILISKSLCQYRLKQPDACRATMAEAVQKFPFALARLFKELNLDNLPKHIWGKSSRSQREGFEAESYALNAKDIWALPDSISFLVESVEIAKPKDGVTIPVDETPLSLDDVRSTLLTGSTPLINLLPRDLTSRPTTASDPLPPEDDLVSYDPHLPETTRGQDAELEAAYADLSEDSDHSSDAANAQSNAEASESVFRRWIPWLRPEHPNSEANVAARRDSRGELWPSMDERRLAYMRLMSVQEEVIRGMARMGDLSSDDREQVREFQQRISELPDERPLGADTSSDLIELWTRFTGESTLPEDMQREVALEWLNRVAARAEDDGTNPSNDDDDVEDDNTPQQETTTSNPDTDPTQAGPSDPADEQAHLQHYLAGTGIQTLRAHLDAHAPDPATDSGPWSTPEGTRLITAYADRLSQLQNRRMRDFILRFSLPQGTSKETGEAVQRRMRG